jgi:hypothetical protein
MQDLSTDQKDFVALVREHAGMALAAWVELRFHAGDDFDAVDQALSRAGSLVRPWRIGRGV